MGAKLSTGALRVSAVLAAAACFGLLESGAAQASTQGFYSAGDHPYTVPAGVTSITVTVIGAPGGNCTPAHGGMGASVTATLSVSPGEALVAAVGGAGSGCNNGPGGFGGGGAGGAGNTSMGSPGAGGGGASVLAPGSSSPELSQAFVVAGGGGGSSDFSSNIGVDGGNAGSPGNNGPLARGGGAGTQSAGGAGGLGGPGGQAGVAGSLGTGGTGGQGATSGVSVGGGGGGGGYYGGGGGGGGSAGSSPTDASANPGGGGGGSSFVVAGATNVTGPTPTSHFADITITWTSPKPVAPGVQITGAKISSRHHTAKFNFNSVGQATGFRCALVKLKKHHKQPKASFSSCGSPKRYKHLKPGHYFFDVFATNSGVPGMPASRRFTIT